MRQAILEPTRTDEDPDLDAYKTAHFEMVLSYLKPFR